MWVVVHVIYGCHVHRYMYVSWRLFVVLMSGGYMTYYYIYEETVTDYFNSRR